MASKSYNQKYYAKNKEKVLQQKKEYYLKNKETICNTVKKYHKKNRNKKLIYNKKYYLDNKDKINTQKKQWRLDNYEYCLEKDKLYYQNNKEKVHAYQRQKRKEDPLFKLANNIRRRINLFIKRKYGKKSEQILGCSYKELIIHLEKQFDSKMTWNNYGTYWHVDHKKALGSVSSEEEIILLCHYTNLQPLEAIENIRKGNK